MQLTPLHFASQARKSSRQGARFHAPRTLIPASALDSSSRPVAETLKTDTLRFGAKLYVVPGDDLLKELLSKVGEVTQWHWDSRLDQHNISATTPGGRYTLRRLFRNDMWQTALQFSATGQKPGTFLPVTPSVYEALEPSLHEGASAALEKELGIGPHLDVSPLLQQLAWGAFGGLAWVHPPNSQCLTRSVIETQLADGTKVGIESHYSLLHPNVKFLQIQKPGYPFHRISIANPAEVVAVRRLLAVLTLKKDTVALQKQLDLLQARRRALLAELQAADQPTAKIATAPVGEAPPPKSSENP